MSENVSTVGEVKDRPRKSTLREIMECLIIAVVLAFIIRGFMFQPFYIPSGSMEPTLQIQDHIIVNKFGHKFWELKPGDIVVFKYPLNPQKDYVKRLIALPGDKVEVRNSHVYVNDRPLAEEYLPPGLRYADFGPVVVPENSYWMMGDNRGNSEDSRVWGPLPRQNVIGKAMLVYWPLDRMRLLTGK